MFSTYEYTVNAQTHWQTCTVRTHQRKDKICVELLNVTSHAPSLQQSDWVIILLLFIFFLAPAYTALGLQGSDWGPVSHASLARLSCPTSPCSTTTFPNQSPHATIIDILYYIRISTMLLTAWIPPCSQDLGAKCGHTMCTYYTTGAKHTVCTIQGTCFTIHCILHVPTTVIVYQHGTLSVCLYSTVY